MDSSVKKMIQSMKAELSTTMCLLMALTFFIKRLTQYIWANVLEKKLISKLNTTLEWLARAFKILQMSKISLQKSQASR